MAMEDNIIRGGVGMGVATGRGSKSSFDGVFSGFLLSLIS